MPNRSSFSDEFRREAVRLLKSSGRSAPELARELGVSVQSLRNWRFRFGDDGERADPLAAEEREELERLRRENRILAEEREILRKAAAFFAKESEPR